MLQCGKKAQVAIEYLLLITVSMALLTAVAAMILNMRGISLAGEAKTLQYRCETIGCEGSIIIEATNKAPSVSLTASPNNGTATVTATLEAAGTDPDAGQTLQYRIKCKSSDSFGDWQSPDPTTNKLAKQCSYENTGTTTIEFTAEAEVRDDGSPQKTKAATAKITVNPTTATLTLTTIEVSPATATMMPGQTQQFTATPKDEFGNTMTGTTINWTNSNTTAGAINASGLFTAATVTATETTTITATATSGTMTKTGTATITINPAGAIGEGWLKGHSYGIGVDYGLLDTFHSAIEDSDGNIVMFGTEYFNTPLFGKYTKGMPLVYKKIQPDLDKLGFSGYYSEGISIIENNDGSYEAAAACYIGSSPRRICIYNISRDGTLVSAKAVGRTAGKTAYYNETPYLLVKATNGYLIAGSTKNSKTGAEMDESAYVLKLDSAGNLESDMDFSGEFGAQAKSTALSVQESSESDGLYYIVAGRIKSGPSGGFDKGFLVKAKSDGGIIWKKIVDSNLFYSIRVVSDGYVVAGTMVSNKNPSYNEQIVLSKFGKDGTLVWAREFGGTGTDYGHSLEKTTDGGFVILGSSAFEEKSNSSYTPYYAFAEPATTTKVPACVLLKTDSQGRMSWYSGVRPAALPGCFSHFNDGAIRVAKDGGFVFAASVQYPGGTGWIYQNPYVSGTGNFGILFGRTDSAGRISGVAQIDSTGKVT